MKKILLISIILISFITFIIFKKTIKVYWYNFLIKNYSDYENKQLSLHKMINENDIEIVKLLLDQGADINSIEEGTTPLHLAAVQYNKEIVKLLLERGANINAHENNNDDGLTVLQVAIDDKEIVKMLLKKGVDVNASSSLGLTALHFAIIDGSKEIVKLLLEKGANVNAISEKHETPLFFAIYENNL